MVPYVVTHAILVVIIMYIFMYIFKRKLDHFTLRLNNRHVVITGGSSGIGLAMAMIVASHGAHVTIIARNVERLQKASEDIRKLAKTDQTVKYVSVDCSDGPKIKEVLCDLDDRLPVYMLVNCAGISISGKLENISDSDMKRMTEINYYGTVFPTKVLLPRMKARNEGLIVITGSQTSLVGLYGYSLYAATKFALRGFAESLDMEAREYNITVTLAVPPDTETPGYIEETKTKPVETQLISDMAGIYKPEQVAKKIVGDVLDGHFFSYIGTPSFFMTMLCAGMSPITSVFELVIQIFLMGWLRLVAGTYLVVFHRIIKNYLDANKQEANIS